MAKIEVLVVDKASKPLKEIDKEAEKVDGSLGDVSEEAKDTSINFQKLAVAATAVAASMAVAVKAAIDSDRAMFGLDTETRKYISSASEAYGINETVIAQYTRIGVSAGLAGGEMATMIDQAVALGRLYPTESTEKMIDNLREFYRTGQDAGHVTYVLENAFKTTKLETIAFTDKIAKLEEITKDVNKQFADTAAGRFDKAMNDLDMTATSLGETMWKLGDQSGALWLVVKALKAGEVVARSFSTGLSTLNLVGQWWLGNETDDAVKLLMDNINKARKSIGELFGENADGSIDMGLITVTGESPFDKGINAMSATVAKAEEEMVELGERYISEFEQFSEGMWGSIEHGATSAFRNMMDGATDWKDMMGDMLKDILAQFFKIYVVQQLIAGYAGSGMSGIIGMFAKGGAFENGVQKFASGGVVDSPTIFPMANGMGLMGESGAEAIMPLTRMSNGNLGVEASPSNITVNNYGNDQVSVNQEGNNIDIVISKIANDVTRGVGSIGSAFEGRYGLRKQ